MSTNVPSKTYIRTIYICIIINKGDGGVWLQQASFDSVAILNYDCNVTLLRWRTWVHILTISIHHYGSLPSPYENATHSTHAYLAHFRVSNITWLWTVQATQKSFTTDTTIRIDDVNPAGVYFFTHALATYHHVHVVYLINLKAEAWEGVGHDLTNHTSL